MYVVASRVGLTAAKRSLIAILSHCSLADKCIDTALHGVQSANATAWRENDLKAIRALIQSKPGGFKVLDSTVKRHLGKWFESKGAVRSAERVQRGSSRVLAKGSSGGSERLAISPTSSGYLDVGGADGDANQPNFQFQPIADGSTTVAVRVGQRCMVKGRGVGVVRFVGTIKTKTQLGVRIGVALDTQTGLHDGTADGTQYFKCRAGHGVITHPRNVQTIGDRVDDTDTVFGFCDGTDD
jgi:hypothetical protein